MSCIARAGTIGWASGALPFTAVAGPSILARRRPSVPTAVTPLPVSSMSTPPRANRLDSLSVAKTVRFTSSRMSGVESSKQGSDGNVATDGNSIGSSAGRRNSLRGALTTAAVPSE